MSGRPGDWHPLTEDGRDPVPGDWELVQEAAVRYRRTADAIQRARTLLREVTDSEQGWQSDAGRAFREKATELSDDVFRAYGRYDAAANALAGYWPELQDAQDESLSLRTQAQEAQGQIDRLGPQVEAAAEEDAENHDQHGTLQGDLEGAQAQLASLRSRLSEIVGAKDAAAQRAADAIGDFIGSDGLEDGFWDHVGGALASIRDALIAIGNIAGFIAAWAGIAALLVGWIPIIGQALAGILGTIALIATCFSLIGNILKGDWVGAGLDVLGIVTFGIARAAGGVARVASQSGRFQAFRSLRGMSQFGNRAARTTRATDIMGDSAGNLRRLSDEAARFARPSGLRGAYGNLGGDMATSLRNLRTANYGSILGETRALPGQLAAGGWRGGLQGGAHQLFGVHNGAADALSMGRAAENGAQYFGMSGAAGLELGSQAVGTAGGMYGNFRDGAQQLQIPSLTAGENILDANVTGVGDLNYSESEALPR
ncbi:hypothetical protein RM780_10955 [Streptomyces sp. DSM 44917]|uniref:WXG100 family type VII secretion target n=1 Tax=Streptomyces boetiae TaxID=3075541 RepID=A0ABU2L7P7_9ACTN|nr:hypothetical protein [Streptomyces sp. DSM 44917]MDT0307481.1 hypothetical protein [Streptomyces sp. DSM 44917]